MKYFLYLLLSVVYLTFVFSSCDPEFLVTSETCIVLAACTNDRSPDWNSEKEECYCRCLRENDVLDEDAFCGTYCHFKVAECEGTTIGGLGGTCECKCDDGWKNPPKCDIKIGNLPVKTFHNNQVQNTRQVEDTSDYFPLWEGNYWEYDAYDSMGMEVVSKLAFAIRDTFTLDTLDTIHIYAYDYIFFDTMGVPNDSLIGLMLYNLPADSNQVFSYTNSSSPFIFHQFEYGDTVFKDGTDYTVVDSVGDVTIPAGTFDGCVWLRDQDSSGQVLAPDIGMIKMISENLDVLELRAYNLPCEFSVQVDTFGVTDCNTNDGIIVLNTYGNNTGLSYHWDGPTEIGDIHNPSNLSTGYYFVTISNSDCSTMIDSIPVAGCANVPVELLDFTAFEFNRNVILEWSTATEVNNAYFQIEHSTDGIRFIPIARITGAGTSYKENSYNYLHTQAVKGVNFYRLKQVDFGGLYEYSDIVSVSIAQIQFSFYPNPAVDRIQVVSSVDFVEATLMNLNGIIIKKIKLRSGHYLDVSYIVEGLYLVQFDGEGVREIHPLVILGK